VDCKPEVDKHLLTLENLKENDWLALAVDSYREVSQSMGL
jgi:hypothetical protein